MASNEPIEANPARTTNRLAYRMIEQAYMLAACFDRYLSCDSGIELKYCTIETRGVIIKTAQGNIHKTEIA